MLFPGGGGGQWCTHGVRSGHQVVVSGRKWSGCRAGAERIRACSECSGYSLMFRIYIWDIQSGYRFPGPPYATVFAHTNACETLGCSGRTLRVILSSKSELGNLLRAQQRARRTVAAQRHCVGGAVATTMAGRWWGSL